MATPESKLSADSRPFVPTAGVPSVQASSSDDVQPLTLPNQAQAANHSRQAAPPGPLGERAPPAAHRKLERYSYADIKAMSGNFDLLMRTDASGALWGGTAPAMLTAGARPIVIRQFGPHDDVFHRELDALLALEACPRLVPALGWCNERVADRHGTERREQLAVFAAIEADHDFTKLKPHEKLLLCRHVSEGLAFMHARRLVHRDVHPCNIACAAAVDAQPRQFLLSGLGFATLLPGGCSVAPEVGWGTQHFVDPDAMATDTVRPEHDVYALGVTIACVFAEVTVPAEQGGADLLSRLRYPQKAALKLAALVRRMTSPDMAARPAAAELNALLRDVDDRGPGWAVVDMLWQCTSKSARCKKRRGHYAFEVAPDVAAHNHECHGAERPQRLVNADAAVERGDPALQPLARDEVLRRWAAAEASEPAAWRCAECAAPLDPMPDFRQHNDAMKQASNAADGRMQ
jgi:hypothetical protein